MSYQKMNQQTWPRKIHCEIFRQSVQPQFSVCLQLDITSFYRFIKERDYLFSLALIHMVTTCANELENFRYRFVDGEVVLYDTIHTSFTYLNEETELFKVINVPIQEKIEDYIALAKEIIAAQDVYFTGPPPIDCYQFSSLPWISFTHISHTISGNPEKSNPMFDWGKFTYIDGRYMLPFSVQVHHSFVDGYHVGKFVERLQQKLDHF